MSGPCRRPSSLLTSTEGVFVVTVRDESKGAKRVGGGYIKIINEEGVA